MMGLRMVESHYQKMVEKISSDGKVPGVFGEN